MIKILTVVGARPQFIKAAAISRAIRNSFDGVISEILLHTGQHYDDLMSAVFFRELEMPDPDYHLGVGSAAHGEQTAAMMSGIEKVILAEKPAAVLVYGDTNSTLAGALAAAKMHVPVVHVEAGLRSFKKHMPEEINRILTDHVSTLLFTPTLAGLSNLETEGFRTDPVAPFNIDNPAVLHCGDVMYDNCLYYSDKAERECDILERLELRSKSFVLVTIHRDINTDDPHRLQEILTSLTVLAQKEKIPFVLPMHPRTRNALKSLKPLNDLPWEKQPGLMIIPPATYLEMMRLERHASMIITDSGGVQKEAYFHHNKCLVLRGETEWVELLDHGMLRLAGTSKEKIMAEYMALKDVSINKWPAIYGDGKAAEFICDVLAENFK